MYNTTHRGILLAVLICLIGFYCGLTNALDFRATGSAPANMLWPTGVPGAKCVNLTDVPTLYPGVVIPSVCYSFVTWPLVYVDENTLIRNVYGRVSMGSWSLPDCLNAEYRQWCSLMFRPCVEVPVPPGYGPANATVAVAQQVCSESCVLLHTVCSGAITDAIEALPGWNQQLVDAALSCFPPWSVLYGDYYRGVPVFPNATYTVPLSYNNNTAQEWNATFDCYYGNANITVQTELICPEGMYEQNGLCYFFCPEPLITSSQYDAITTMVSVMAWISVVCCAFLALTNLMDPDRRKFPANLSIFFILCVLCLCFSFCIGNMAGWNNTWCNSEGQPNTFGGGACTVQGLLFVYFSLASVLWWLVLSINLLLMVTKVQPNSIKLHWVDYFKGLREPRGYLRWESLFLGYHIFVWVPPFIPLIIALSAQRLGYSGHDIWCTINSADPVSFYYTNSGSVAYTGGDPSNIWNLILLTVPILVIVCLGITILIVVIVWAIWKTGWRFFYQQWRLFLFIMFYVWIYTFVFSFQIDLSVQANAQYQAYTDYINCQIVSAGFAATASPELVPQDCGSPTTEISFPLWFVVCFNEASQGLLLFLLYGTSWRFYKIWYLLFKNPKALISSRFQSTDSDNSKKIFTVEGRKVGTNTAGGSTASKRMMDEIGSEDEDSSSSVSEEGSEDGEDGGGGGAGGDSTIVMSPRGEDKVVNNDDDEEDKDEDGEEESESSTENGEGMAMKDLGDKNV